MIKNYKNNFLSDRALFNLGFRPFFLGAMVFSIVTVTLWMLVYAFSLQIPMQPLSGFQWHAHEMIFGYSFAVIAGFLLTAVQNWTGVPTLHGLPLLVLFSLWIIARVLLLFGTTFIYLAAIFDLLFESFFIERGVGYPVTLYNPKWLAVLSLLLFIGFFIVEIFIYNRVVSGGLAAGLFIITSVRLVGWYTRGIWKNPLLWGLYFSFVFIAAGFLLFALGAFAGVSKFLAIHSLAYGGIGIVTVSMMARVSLGHTGRDVHHPPKPVFIALLLLILGTISRVGLPLLDMQHYMTWIVVSQVLWIIAFLIMVITYAPILGRPRIDGKPG